jgi:PAS domain S-box-containing protein
MDALKSNPRFGTAPPDAFALLMKSVSDYAVVLMDPHGAILGWGAGAVRMFGFDPGETLGRNVSFLFPSGEIAEGIPERELKAAVEKGCGRGEGWSLRKDGTKFWGASVVYPLAREGGEPIGYVKIVRDSSVEREASETLSDTAREMEFVLENLKDHAFFLIDSKGLIASWNTGSERVFGFKSAEAIGKAFSIIFTPEDIQAGIPGKELDRAQSAGKAEDERWHERKDGSRFWASGAVVPLPGETGKSRFIKVVRDATDRKRAEDADRMESIGRLAGGVAHDYNNMLTSIIGYCELLAASTVEDDPHQGWLSEILTSANRAAMLTRDLLAFSRKQMIAPVQANLNEIVGEMQNRLRMTMGDRIRLLINPDPDLETALLDRLQMGQVLLNFALNAKEAMPEGGTVTIGTRSAKATAETTGTANAAGAATAVSAATALSAASIANTGEILSGPSGEKAEAEPKAYVTLSFKDDGQGMDAETAAHAFDPFFSTKPRASGSVGMGLATVYGIIQQSGGTISVTSMPGCGTEFVVHLPVYAQEDSRQGERLQRHHAGTSPANPAAPQGEGSDRKTTILLVEDEMVVRKLASEILRKNGFLVLEALNGEDGLAIFSARTHTIDAVVTDVVMPKMSGLVMARNILSRRPDVPIIFMSGFSDDPLGALNMPHQKCVFLHKPFSVAALLGKIGQVIDSKRIPEKAI